MPIVRFRRHADNPVHELLDMTGDSSDDCTAEATIAKAVQVVEVLPQKMVSTFVYFNSAMRLGVSECRADTI